MTSELRRSTAGLVVWFGLLAGYAQLAQAQQAFWPVPAFAPQPAIGVIDVANEAQRQLEAIVQRHRELSQTRMAVTIEELNRVCRLEPAQLKKLQVAAKGAVEQALESWRKQLAGGAPNFGGDVQFFAAGNAFIIGGQGAAAGFVDNPPQPVQVDSDGDDDAATVEYQDPAAIRMDDAVEGGQVIPPPVFAIPAQGVPFGAPPLRAFAQAQWHVDVGLSGDLSVETQKVWVRALETILTEEQKQLHQASVRERKQRRQKAALDLVMVTLEEILLLSAQQHEQLSKLVESHCGEQLAEMPDAGAAMFIAVGIALELPQAELQELLTEAQQKRLQDMQQGGAFAPAIRGDVAVPLIPLQPAQQLDDGNPR